MQTMLIEKAFDGINWQCYNSNTFGHSKDTTVQDIVNYHLKENPGWKIERVEYMDIKRLSGYPAPNEFICTHAAVIYYTEHHGK